MSSSGKGIKASFKRGKNREDRMRKNAASNKPIIGQSNPKANARLPQVFINHLEINGVYNPGVYSRLVNSCKLPDPWSFQLFTSVLRKL